MEIRYFFIVIFLFTSCLGSKKVAEKSSTSKESIKTDSVATETVNKGISDEATFKIRESETGDDDFDERVNNAVSNILRSINFQKSSGDNSYKVYYDEKLNELKAQIEVGETKNKETATSSDIQKEDTFTEKTEKVIRTLPWWIWIIAFVVFFKPIMNVIGVIYSPARGIASLSELFTVPKKE